MKIIEQKVVSITMIVKNAEGEIVDQASEQDPLVYLHGHNNLFPALEEELEGKQMGDKVSLTLTPETGYGERDESLVSELPSSQFQGVDTIEAGMMFQADSPQGPVMLTVIGVDGDSIKVDANHPMAGQTLSFEIEVKDIRDATAEEISHGHPHGEREED